jgi:hypothetical protein
VNHDDPDNSGQCIYCGTILDATDEDYDADRADAPCPGRPDVLPLP